MWFELIFLFLDLICYCLFGPTASLPENKYETVFHTDIFEAFTPLPEYPKNVTRSYTFELLKVYLAPDGFTRPVWSVNGQYPGPIIRANIGDRFNITVINRLGDPSAIHWHGIEQRGINWFDGVPGTTQCPIPNGINFSYVFDLQQSGTHWYHAHILAQLVEGLRGPIIIHDPDDPNKHEYDYEYVMTVADWYHTPTDDPRMLPLLHSANYKGFDPIPDSADISGVGQYNCTIPTCTPSKFATYKVKEGKKYRFRIINMSTMSHFWVSIDKHPLTIIETDGTPVRPATVDALRINIAQRYSVVVHANQPVDSYYIKARIPESSLPVNNYTFNFDSPLLKNDQVTGILRYEGAPDKLPTYNGPSINASDCYDMDASLLKPYPLNPPVPRDENLTTLEFEINVILRDNYLQGVMNNSTYSPNLTYPTNKRIIDGDNFSTSDNVYYYHGLNSPIQIVLNNTENRTHPFHLHGHSFWIIAQGEIGSHLQPLNSLKFNFDDPPFRDIITLKELSLNVIRYYANNPGVWLLHCHMEWHIELGMVVQLVELPEIFSKYVIPNDIHRLCTSI
ncbi:14634_t:CDS:2 [Acaulospora morrowiae]|uniref:14634_t:CDS:1 n=1 Tax=Acaulospora morrowiae TaxID=94023 RepID=A0A9N9AI07_9GLOM|nr:14634_t:CDS:2 [Acaulospora morrowiae]